MRLKESQTSTMIPFKEIKIVEGRNPRIDFGDIEDLAQSIRYNGLKRALEVEFIDEQYFLVDGERRHRALTQLEESGFEFKYVPAVLVDEYITDDEVLFSMLVNNDGKPLLPIEESQAFSRLIDENISPNQIALRIGKSITYVKDRLALLGASEGLKKAVADGDIPVSLATDIAKKSEGDEEKQDKLLKAATENKSAVKREIYGFRLPKRHKTFASLAVQVMKNNSLEAHDLEVTDEDRNSRIYIAAMMETLALINDGSVADVIAVAEKG